MELLQKTEVTPRRNAASHRLPPEEPECGRGGRPRVDAATAHRVWLVGNYAADQQESMQRFAAFMQRELAQRSGWEPRLIQPKPILGRFIRSAQGLGKWLGYFDKLVIFPRRLQALAQSTGSNDLFHICDHSNAVYTRFIPQTPHLVTCHDLLAVRSALGEIPQNPVRWTGRKLQSKILSGLNHAGRVACVSHATRDDLLRLTTLKASQVSVVYNGLNFSYTPVEAREALDCIQAAAPRLGAELAAGRSFILHVGGDHWYKNRLGVLRLYAALQRTMTEPPLLVMAGAPLTSDMKEFIHRGSLKGLVLEVVRPASRTLQALYSRASLFLFPSLAEGFGWPIIEAQACGCPVATTRKEPMVEVAGKSAIYLEFAVVQPGASEQQLEFAARQLAEALHAPPQAARELRAKSRSNAARFSARQMVDGYVALYEQMLGATKTV